MLNFSKYIMRISLFLIFWLPFSAYAQSTTIVSGPMLGHQTDEKASVWMLLKGVAHAASPTGDEAAFQLPVSAELELMLNDLKSRGYDEMEYDLQAEPVEEYRTLKLYLTKSKKDTINDFKVAKNFSFLMGSCAFPYPYKGLKGKNKDFIFKSMTSKVSNFMLWLGDNVYYLDREWRTYEKMYLRNATMRQNKYLNEFIQSRPQYAIWDDHDYGPNNSDGTYVLKDTALAVFQNFWLNPAYGTKKTAGNFSSFSYEDVDFFLLDGRYYRSEKDEEMFGEGQMKWLKKKLKKSTANFKIIAAGTQMLPEDVAGECWHDYKDERKDFLKFLEKENIEGVIFLSGDRHYTELNFDERKKTYPLYEFTCSPLTSLGNPAGRIKNPIRSRRSLYMKQNFGRVSFSGDPEDRQCMIEVYNKKGSLVWSHVIALSDLKKPEKKEKKEETEAPKTDKKATKKKEKKKKNEEAKT